MFGHYLGLSNEKRQDLVQEINGKLLPVGTPATEILEFLGPEDGRLGRALRYDFGLRPDHVFEFLLSDDSEKSLDSGYGRRIPRRFTYSMPTSGDEANICRAELVRFGATASELISAFGEPADRSGWWPYEAWTYPGVFTLELRLGVVEG